MIEIFLSNLNMCIKKKKNCVGHLLAMFFYNIIFISHKKAAVHVINFLYNISKYYNYYTQTTK